MKVSILCSNFIQGVILKLLHALALLWIYTVHIFVSHTALLLNSMYYSNFIHLYIFNRSSQNACCSHSSVDTHTGSVENIITVCLHVLSGGGNVQQLYM